MKTGKKLLGINSRRTLNGRLHMPNDENMDVENIDNEVVETETTQEEQETQEGS